MSVSKPGAGWRSRFESKGATSPFRIDDYYRERPWNWTSRHTGMEITLPGIHRPLERYTRALQDAGFVIETDRLSGSWGRDREDGPRRPRSSGGGLAALDSALGHRTLRASGRGQWLCYLVASSGTQR